MACSEVQKLTDRWSTTPVLLLIYALVCRLLANHIAAINGVQMAFVAVACVV